MTLASESGFDAKRGVFYCAWPGCEYESKDPVAVHMHYYAKHVNPAKRRAAVQAAKDPEAAGDCPVDGCAGKLRLLHPYGPEGVARRQGFALVCIVCGEVTREDGKQIVSPEVDADGRPAAGL